VGIHGKGLITMPRKRRGRSEGSIFFREADSQWVGSISLGYDGDGKRKRRTVYGATKREVQDKIQALQGQALTGSLPTAARLTVGEYLDRWLANTAKSTVQPTSYTRYERLVRMQIKPLLGRIQLAGLNALHIENFYSEMARAGVNPRTSKMAGGLLTNALNHAVRPLKLIATNPAVGIKKARPTDIEMQFLTDPQARLFLETARPHRLFALFSLAIASGMRQGEMLALRWTDIDFDKSTVAVSRSLAYVDGGFLVKEPKSKGSRRTITLPRFAVEALREHRQSMLREGNISAPVFCTLNGQYILNTNLTRRVFKPLIRKTNENIIRSASTTEALPDIRFHDLRHTHATSLLASGHSIKAVSQRLGHADIKVTLQVYAHVLPTDDAVLADGLDRLFG
jgi:integrase